MVEIDVLLRLRRQANSALYLLDLGMHDVLELQHALARKQRIQGSPPYAMDLIAGRGERRRPVTKGAVEYGVLGELRPRVVYAVVVVGVAEMDLVRADPNHGSWCSRW